VTPSEVSSSFSFASLLFAVSCSPPTARQVRCLSPRSHRCQSELVASVEPRLVFLSSLCASLDPTIQLRPVGAISLLGIEDGAMWLVDRDFQIHRILLDSDAWQLRLRLSDPAASSLEVQRIASTIHSCFHDTLALECLAFDRQNCAQTLQVSPEVLKYVTTLNTLPLSEY